MNDRKEEKRKEVVVLDRNCQNSAHIYMSKGPEKKAVREKEAQPHHRK